MRDGVRRRPAPLAVLLLAVLLHAARAQEVLGEVYIKTSNYTFDPFPDLPADFGPDIPEEGIEGLLVLADPEEACRPFTFELFDQPWVALISRSQQARMTNCTFDIKVRHAEMAGAVAAIVYDDSFEPLIIMSKPFGHPEPHIPAVFVSQKAGIIMRKLLTPGQTRVRIMPISDVAWMSVVMSAFLALLALTVVMSSFYVMRSWSVWLGRARGDRAPPQDGFALLHNAGEGLSPSEIRALPVAIHEHHSSGSGGGKPAAEAAPGTASGTVGELLLPLLPSPEDEAERGEAEWPAQVAAAVAAHSRSSSSGSSEGDAEGPRLPLGSRGGATRKLCVICLERYTEGEKVRVLPCQHRFHLPCVDQWLSSRRYCPVCKHDAGTPLLPVRASDSGAGGSSVVGAQPENAHGQYLARLLQLVGGRRMLAPFHLSVAPSSGPPRAAPPQEAVAPATAGPPAEHAAVRERQRTPPPSPPVHAAAGAAATPDSAAAPPAAVAGEIVAVEP